jgi:alkylation response protein AidB-like acyl-CoA dehydrogenase
VIAACEPGAEADSQSFREARRIADEVLFPAALAVDAGDPVLGGHLDLLAEKGFYGLFAPEPLTALDLPDHPSARRVVEILAGGCLTTALVWGQHHGAVTAAAKTGNEAVRETYLAALASGRCRAGLAGAAARPGPALLRATPVDGGWAFDGLAPWVTGWGMVDTVHVVGRDERDMLVWALLDATAGDSMSVEPLDMVAVRASQTVTVRFTRHFVPHERVTATVPHAVHLQGDAETVRFTGSLALGVAGRAVSLLGGDGGGLAGELRAVRAMPAGAGPRDVSAARAAGSELALRAAAALAVHGGSRSVLLETHAQRLVREATFLLVFGSRPGIRTGLLDRLTTPRHARQSSETAGDY